MKRRVGVLSLGCPRNLVDTESILSRLSDKGYKIVDIDKARIALVNTCAFTKEAKEESIEVILDLIDLKKQGKVDKIIIYGCLAQRYQCSLAKEFPEVDAFVGRVSLDNSVNKVRLTPNHYAYLKICEGCINYCSFCIIPKIKGKLTSASIASILKKTKEFNRQGISELNIIGQDITAFGLDLKPRSSLTELLKKILKVSKNIGWIRLLYLYPERVTEELLKIIRSEERVCKYIDLPIQHVNNRILRLMNRKTTKSQILKLIERIRKAIPNVSLRTSIIVGFPGEREREFKELLAFIKEVKFERLGAFKYSREEGTVAYNFPGQVLETVKTQRFNEVMSSQSEVASLVNSKSLGGILKVLIEERNKDGYIGRTEFDAPEVDGLVYVKSKFKLNPGDFVKVKIIDTLEYDLVGEVQDELS